MRDLLVTTIKNGEMKGVIEMDNKKAVTTNEVLVKSKKGIRLPSEKIEFIKNHYKSMTREAMAEATGLTKKQVQSYCSKQKFEPVLTKKPITSVEVEYIKNNVRNMTIKELAEKMGRSKRTLEKYCKRNGLKSKYAGNIRKVTDEGKEIIKESHKTNKVVDIAALLGVSKSTIYRHLRNMGIYLREIKSSKKNKVTVIEEAKNNILGGYVKNGVLKDKCQKWIDIHKSRNSQQQIVVA